MTTEEALRFLEANQPLPADEQLDEARIEKFNAVREHFSSVTDPRCIPLILSAFGDGSGFGIYQLFDSVFDRYPTQFLSSHLSKALSSEHPWTRYWAAQYAMEYPHPDLFDSVKEAVDRKCENDEDARYFLIAFFEFLWRDFKDYRALKELRKLQGSEESPEIRELLDEMEVLGADAT